MASNLNYTIVLKSNSKDMEMLFFEITKNLDFLQFGIVKIISMIFAVNQSLKRIPVAFKLLQLMKRINI